MCEIVCFIHSCTLDTWGSQKLTDLIGKLRDSGLLDRLSNVFINNVGTTLPEDLYPEGNIWITNYSTSTDQFENCTLRQMHFYAQLHPDHKLLYLHTKGVSYPLTHPHTPNITDWVDFMSYGLITHHRFCTDMLDHVDTVGMNYRSIKMASPQYPDPDHFSGNYWWVTAKYWSTAPIHELKTKYDAEWILFKKKPTFVHIWKCPVGHYENSYKLSEYQGLVNDRIRAYRELFTAIIPEEKQEQEKVKIYYGVAENYTDVTDKCLSKDVIHVPAGDGDRNQLLGDPLPGTVKHIKIGGLTFGYEEEVNLRYYTD